MVANFSSNCTAVPVLCVSLVGDNALLSPLSRSITCWFLHIKRLRRQEPGPALFVFSPSQLEILFWLIGRNKLSIRLGERNHLFCCSLVTRISCSLWLVDNPREEASRQ